MKSDYKHTRHVQSFRFKDSNSSTRELKKSRKLKFLLCDTRRGIKVRLSSSKKKKKFASIRVR